MISFNWIDSGSMIDFAKRLEKIFKLLIVRGVNYCGIVLQPSYGRIFVLQGSILKVF